MWLQLWRVGGISFCQGWCRPYGTRVLCFSFPGTAVPGFPIPPLRGCGDGLSRCGADLSLRPSENSLDRRIRCRL
jgi:hypothetical protein